MMRTLSLLLAALAIAGCVNVPAPVGPGDDTVPTTFGGEVTKDRVPKPDFDFTNVIDPDHGGLWNGHAIAELHTGSYGLTLVGYNALTGLTEGSSETGQDSGYGALDTWGHFVCVTHFAGTGGATIVDIQDPTKPRVLSSVDSGMVNSDCQFTDDGNYLLVAAYTGTNTGLQGAPAPLRDVASNGVLLYDVKDKAAPKFLFLDTQGATDVGSGAYHNVFTATINGTVYVFQTYTGNILSFTPGEPHLKMVANVEVADHDMWVGRHPASGHWIMITGAGDGTRIYDMEHPAEPTLLGEWEGHDGYTGWHRQWPLMNTVEGRALMLVAGEDCGGGKSLPYTVLDFTDPTDLIEMGHWQIPNKPAPPPGPHLCEMTAHEFESWDGYVATGNYHAGLWLLDIGSLERAAQPVVLGYYLPHETPQMHGGTTNKPFYWNPDVWGGYFDERGYIYAADWASGLYVLKFDATTG